MNRQDSPHAAAFYLAFALTGLLMTSATLWLTKPEWIDYWLHGFMASWLLESITRFARFFR